MNPTPSKSVSPWPHRWAWLLVCVTFPLIWVGGLVTSYDAGMAVEDWPGTYGYNLFLYPWKTWVFGPWDLFIEHGHRLLGALAGVVTILLNVSVWRGDGRQWMRWVAGGALLLVIGQGLLGGGRVVQDARVLAMIHGCVGPLFFAYCVAMVVFTSRVWREASPQPASVRSARLQRLALFTALLSFLQLVLGAQVRHVSVMASPGQFGSLVFFHLVFAVLLTVHVGLLAVRVRRDYDGVGLARPAALLVALIGLQLLLGGATWVVKYGWPWPLIDFGFASGFTIQEKSLAQMITVTAHVATGSLILATSVSLLVRSCRFMRPPGTLFRTRTDLAGMVA